MESIMTELTLYFYENNLLYAEIKRDSDKTLSIGRNSSNDIVFNNLTVSGSHSKLEIKDGELLLTDLNSKNGTVLNGKNIESNQPVKIEKGDEIHFGNDKCKLIIKEDKKEQELPKEPNKTFKIGRNEDSDIWLNDRTVSRNHATLKKLNENEYELTDLNSTNGTFYQGKKIKKVIIDSTDDFIINKYIIKTDGTFSRLDDKTVVKLDTVSKTFPNNLTAIQPLSLEIKPKTLTAIMGPSGCGKSTLLKMINGMIPNSSGKISLFDLELDRYYNYFKSQIGYVPQDDTIHLELTVYQSIFYAAKLRLEHLGDTEIELRINSLLKKLKIEKIKHHLNAKISGGQRKRVCIAIELLSDPMLLLLDEPTSPLDPQSIGEFMEILQELTKAHTTVVMVTHKPEDLQFMDEVIFLAENGYLAYKGKVKNYLNHFKVDAAVAVYAQLSGENAEQWTKVEQKGTFSQHKEGNFSEKQKVNWSSQLYWLTSRALKIKTNDRLNSLIIVLQAPIIAFLIGFIFKEVNLGVLFMMVISSVWFGVNNAAREIVKEKAIFNRERMFNLYNGSYLFSKLNILFLIAAIQTILFTIILFLMYAGTANPLQDFFKMMYWLLFVNLVSATMGLMISAAMKSSDKVLALVPIILIPQLMLSGVITKIHNGLIEFISYFTFSRWATEGLAHIQDIVLTNGMNLKVDSAGTPLKNAAGKFIFDRVKEKQNAVSFLNKQFHSSYSDIFGDLSTKLSLDFTMLLLLGIFLLLITYGLLKKKIK